MPLSIPEKSIVYADSGYTNYGIEDLSKEADNIELLTARKKNSIRKREPYTEYIIESMRKRIETTFSEISGMFPKRIHAVTNIRLILKIILFLFSYSLNKI
jgi:hypothetical protein